MKATENGSIAAMDVSSLPMRVALDIQRHLKRQPHEGALAFSQTALQELQSRIPFYILVRQLFALRQECDTFSNLFLSDRLLCDQLHVAMSVSEAYKVKILHKATVDALTAPPEVPANGDVLIHWTSVATSRSHRCVVLVFLCPLRGEGPLVARAEVDRLALRSLFDKLHADLEHSKPAELVTTSYLEERLCLAARLLRGDANTAVDSEITDALSALVDTLMPSETREHVDAANVVELLCAFTRLLDQSGSALRVSHQELNLFLRAVFTPLSAFADNAA